MAWKKLDTWATMRRPHSQMCSGKKKTWLNTKPGGTVKWRLEVDRWCSESPPYVAVSEILMMKNCGEYLIRCCFRCALSFVEIRMVGTHTVIRSTEILGKPYKSLHQFRAKCRWVEVIPACQYLLWHQKSGGYRPACEGVRDWAGEDWNITRTFGTGC